MNGKWFFLGAGVLIGGILVGAATTTTTGAPPPKPKPVQVTNFPSPQNVSGTVQVSNFPASQAVSGTVIVGNLPTVQGVSGTVQVGNFPTSQAVSGTVSVGNFPAVQTVAGATSISNLPVDGQGNLRVAGIADLNTKLSTLIGGSSQRFVGVTSATSAGGEGWKAMSDMCRSEFSTGSPGVHMCFSADIVHADPSAWPTIPLDHPGWVQPVIQYAVLTVPGSGNGSTVTSLLSIDVSGAFTSSGLLGPDSLSCTGWSTGDSRLGGLMIAINGGFAVNTCDAALGVACCAP